MAIHISRDYSHNQVKKLRDAARRHFGTGVARAYDVWVACEKWLGNYYPCTVEGIISFEEWVRRHEEGFYTCGYGRPR